MWLHGGHCAAEKVSTSVGEQLIFNALVEFFEEDEWDFQWMEGLSVLSMGFRGRNGSWTCFAQAREVQQQFVFYSVLPVFAIDEKKQAIAEFLTRANYGMIIGNFEMDFEDGEIRYKTSIDVEGAVLSPPLIRQTVYANIIITDRYLPGLMKVLYGQITPSEAIEQIEGADDEDDSDADSPESGLANNLDDGQIELFDADYDEFDAFDDEVSDDDDYDDYDDDDFDDDDDDPLNGNNPNGYSLN